MSGVWFVFLFFGFRGGNYREESQCQNSVNGCRAYQAGGAVGNKGSGHQRQKQVVVISHFHDNHKSCNRSLYHTCEITNHAQYDNRRSWNTWQPVGEFGADAAPAANDGAKIPPGIPLR